MTKKPNKDRIRDEQILMAMHLVENVGLTMKAAGEIVGMTKNAVIGASRRVNIDHRWQYCHCKKRENMDGGLKELWWATTDHAKGLVDHVVSGSV
jgi:hypothetical protein